MGRFVSMDVESVTIAWAPPLDNGGTDIIGYVVDFKEAKKEAWSSVTACTAKISYRISKLRKHETYVFRVMAENAMGLSAPLVSGRLYMDYGYDVPPCLD